MLKLVGACLKLPWSHHIWHYVTTCTKYMHTTFHECDKKELQYTYVSVLQKNVCNTGTNSRNTFLKQ